MCNRRSPIGLRPRFSRAPASTSGMSPSSSRAGGRLGRPIGPTTWPITTSTRAGPTGRASSLGCDADEHRAAINEVHRRVAYLSTQGSSVEDKGALVWNQSFGSKSRRCSRRSEDSSTTSAAITPNDSRGSPDANCSSRTASEGPPEVRGRPVSDSGGSRAIPVASNGRAACCMAVDTGRRVAGRIRFGSRLGSAHRGRCRWGVLSGVLGSGAPVVLS